MVKNETIVERDYNGQKTLFLFDDKDQAHYGFQFRVVTPVTNLKMKSTAGNGSGRTVRLYRGADGKTYEVYTDKSVRVIN